MCSLIDTCTCVYVYTCTHPYVHTCIRFWQLVRVQNITLVLECSDSIWIVFERHSYFDTYLVTLHSSLSLCTIYYLTHPLLTLPLRSSPFWREVQNVNFKNPVCLLIIHSILHKYLNYPQKILSVSTGATAMLFRHIYPII